jgi:hypothetical protein
VDLELGFDFAALLVAQGFQELDSLFERALSRTGARPTVGVMETVSDPVPATRDFTPRSAKAAPSLARTWRLPPSPDRVQSRVQPAEWSAARTDARRGSADLLALEESARHTADMASATRPSEASRRASSSGPSRSFFIMLCGYDIKAPCAAWRLVEG